MSDIIRKFGDNYSVTEYANRSDWLRGRHNYLGASDAASVLGISPWMTNVQLYENKVNPVVDEKPPTEQMLRGIKSESHIRELYAIESGDDVEDGTGKMLVSIEHPFMSCTLDGACVDKNGKPYVLEIKSVNYSRNWANKNLPDHYFVQCLHQLAVTGWDKSVLVARIIMPADGDVVTRKFEILYKENIGLVEALVEKERIFWHENVMKKIPPNKILPSI